MIGTSRFSYVFSRAEHPFRRPVLFLCLVFIVSPLGHTDKGNPYQFYGYLMQGSKIFLPCAQSAC
ncbi:hypothetical protein B5F54_04380 [Anaeromassilibacillus sp. An250]|nr:hypothetical protein B5F54_04380 [Anaeromassilibacillus sp. An250]